MKITKAKLKQIIKEELDATMGEEPERPAHRDHAVGHAETLAPQIMEMVYNTFWIDDTVEGEEEMFQEAIKQLILDWYTSTGTFESLPGSKHPEYKYYDKPNFRK